MRYWITILLVGALLAITLADSDPTDSAKDDSTTKTVEEDQEDGYYSPIIDDYYFMEHFDDMNNYNRQWKKSEAKKDGVLSEIAQYDGIWSVEAPQRRIFKKDFGLVLKSKVKHAAISSWLKKPFQFTDKPLIVQYEVTLQDGQECGGSYMKLLSQGGITDLKQFTDQTPYTIMFGPDKCGNDIKLHFIFRHKNPINGSIEEKHCRKPKDRLEEPFKDKQPHLYTLIVRPDNTYTIKVDHKVVNEGSLLTDFTPPVNPPEMIDDPNDFKPADFDEREKINDPLAVKPEDWDEDAPPQIPDMGTSKPDGWLDDEEPMMSDPNAIKPDDWDTDMDGEWEAPLITNPMCEKAVGCGLWERPLIPNPDYRGKWRPPLIDNPNYIGKWKPKQIINPDFFEDLHPFKMAPISAIGFELWSISGDILFDNILITDKESDAEHFASQTFDMKKQKLDEESESFVTRVINYTNDNPYLWGVYVVFIGLPLAFLVYYCCKEKETNFEISTAKKTDAPTKDDDEIDDDRAEDANEDAGEDEDGDYGDEGGDEEAEEDSPLQSDEAGPSNVDNLLRQRSTLADISPNTDETPENSETDDQEPPPLIDSTDDKATTAATTDKVDSIAKSKKVKKSRKD